jgi:hypothetical protein
MFRGEGWSLPDGNGRIDLANLRRPETHDANKVDVDMWLMEIQVGHAADEEKTGQPALKNRGGKVAPKVSVSFPSATIPEQKPVCGMLYNETAG